MTVQPGPIRHDTLSVDQEQRIKQLKETLRDADPSSLAQWLDDFKRDQDPEREIRVFEGMAQAYTAYCNPRSLTSRAKQEVLQVLAARSEAPEGEVLQHLSLKVLSLAAAKDILRLYKQAPEPITVCRGKAECPR